MFYEKYVTIKATKKNKKEIFNYMVKTGYNTFLTEQQKQDILDDLYLPGWTLEIIKENNIQYKSQNKLIQGINGI